MEQDSGIEEVVGEGGRRISRRTLIKGSAVVGATVWAAPVVESFTSRAFAGSLPNYCCACGSPSSTQPTDVATAIKNGKLDPPQANQSVSDNHPPSVADCVAFCNGTPGAPLQPYAYTKFIWCGPSPTGFSAGTGSAGYGCYINNSPDTGCTSGTITYNGSGVSTGYTSTNKSASGVF